MRLDQHFRSEAAESFGNSRLSGRCNSLSNAGMPRRRGPVGEPQLGNTQPLLISVAFTAPFLTHHKHTLSVYSLNTQSFELLP